MPSLLLPMKKAQNGCTPRWMSARLRIGMASCETKLYKQQVESQTIFKGRLCTNDTRHASTKRGTTQFASPQKSSAGSGINASIKEGCALPYRNWFENQLQQDSSSSWTTRIQEKALPSTLGHTRNILHLTLPTKSTRIQELSKRLGPKETTSRRLHSVIQQLLATSNEEEWACAEMRNLNPQKTWHLQTLQALTSEKFPEVSSL